MSDFKANSAAFKIQFALKLNNCIKNLEKFQNIKLNKLSSSISFDEFRKIIIKPEVIEITKQFVNTLETFKSGLKINPKVLITAYLLKSYPSELVGTEKNLHPSDMYIIELSTSLVDILESNKINNIWNKLKEFKLAFEDWSHMDKARTIEKLITSYYYRCEHLDKIKSGELVKKQEYVDKEQQEQMIAELQRQKNQIINLIKQIDKNFDIKYLEANYVEIFNHIQQSWAQLHVNITNTMKKAYYNMLSNDISNGNLLSCFSLIKEIGQRLTVLCPKKSQTSFASKFSDDVLTELLSEPEYTNQLIKFIGFMLDFIIQMDAPVNDESNAQWKIQVAELIKSPFAQSFPQILIQIEEHIDQIYQTIIDLNQQ